MCTVSGSLVFEDLLELFLLQEHCGGDNILFPGTNYFHIFHQFCFSIFNLYFFHGRIDDVLTLICREQRQNQKMGMKVEKAEKPGGIFKVCAKSLFLSLYFTFYFFSVPLILFKIVSEPSNFHII